MKELQKQNEMRVMEIHHVKSQIEVTKVNIQVGVEGLYACNHTEL